MFIIINIKSLSLLLIIIIIYDISLAFISTIINYYHIIIIVIGRKPLGSAPPGLEESGPPSAAVTAPTVAPDGPPGAGDRLGTDLSDDSMGDLQDGMENNGCTVSGI